MKTVTLSILLVGLLFSGCGKKEEPGSQATNAPSSTSGGNPLTAPADYGAALVRGQKIASKTIDTVGLNQALQMYNASEGHYPKALQDLVPDYIPKLPEPPAGMKLEYNPASGQVKMVPK